MSLIDKVIYYLNDVLVSLDISPIHRNISKKNNDDSKTSASKEEVQA